MKTGLNKLLGEVICLRCFVVVAYCLAYRHCEAQAIEYSGTISRSVIGLDGNPSGTPALFTFSVNTFSNYYQIVRDSKQAPSSFDEVVGADGIDCYFLQKRWPTWKDKETNSNYKENPQVSAGLYPSLASTEAELLWLLFCSKGHLIDKQPIILSSIYYAPYDSLNSRIQYANNGNFPEHIEVFSPGIMLIKGKEQILPSQFQNGYKLWDFVVKDLRTTNGVTCPVKAELAQYSVISDGTNLASRCIRKFEIIVTNINVSADMLSDYRPVLTQTNLTVLDYRFSPQLPRPDMGGVDVIQYQLQTKNWVGRSNSLVQASAVSLQMTTNFSREQPNQGRRRILLGILALTIIAPLSILLMRRKKS
jgi:hypothetical protein